MHPRIYPVKFAKAIVRSIPSTCSEKRRPFNLPVPSRDSFFLCWLGDGVNTQQGYESLPIFHPKRSRLR